MWVCVSKKVGGRGEGREFKTLALGFGSGSVLAELGLIGTEGSWPRAEISGLSGTLMWAHED